MTTQPDDTKPMMILGVDICRSHDESSALLSDGRVMRWSGASPRELVIAFLPLLDDDAKREMYKAMGVAYLTTNHNFVPYQGDEEPEPFI